MQKHLSRSAQPGARPGSHAHEDLPAHARLKPFVENGRGDSLVLPAGVGTLLRLAAGVAIAVSFALAFQPEFEALGAALQPDRIRCEREIVRIWDGNMWIECTLRATPGRSR